jgi:DNA-binding CsgD family transcriptional regulator
MLFFCAGVIPAVKDEEETAGADRLEEGESRQNTERELLSAMKERRREWTNASPQDRDLARRRFMKSVQAFNAVVFFEERPLGLLKSGESGLSEPQLTPREVQVLEKIAMGLTGKEIADELNVSFKTVVTHRSHIMGKFKVGNTALLIRRAIAFGYIEP